MRCQKWPDLPKQIKPLSMVTGCISLNKSLSVHGNIFMVYAKAFPPDLLRQEHTLHPKSCSPARKLKINLWIHCILKWSEINYIINFILFKYNFLSYLFINIYYHHHYQSHDWKWSSDQITAGNLISSLYMTWLCAKVTISVKGLQLSANISFLCLPFLLHKE